jgi:hypothetical protein
VPLGPILVDALGEVGAPSVIANTYTRGVRGNNGRDMTKDQVCKRQLPECKQRSFGMSGDAQTHGRSSVIWRMGT